MSGLRVIDGGKDTARNAQRRYARPHLRRWIAAGQLLACGEGVVKFRPAHIDLMNKLTNFPSANEFYCFASQQTVGEKMGVSLRTARRLFSDLKNAKLIAPKRRGLGKTAIWVFCIDGVPLSASKFAAQDRPSVAAQGRPSVAAQDRPSVAAQGRPSVAAQDRPSVADKPFEIESLECEPLRTLATPAPAPPVTEPLAREGDEIAAEVLAKLPASSSVHPVWRGLSAWIAQLLTDGADRVDIAVGFAGCLHTLHNRAPNSLAYFSAAIERARIARTAPLPEVAAKPDQPHLLGQAGDILKKRLGADVFDSWFGKATLINVSGGTVTIGIETAFMRSRIIANYQTACTEAFQAVSPIPIVRLVVVVGGAPIGAGSP